MAGFDAVVAVHLRSTFLTSRYVANIWRHKSEAGETVDARIINSRELLAVRGPRSLRTRAT